MDAIPCCHCGEYFSPSPRHRNQRFCRRSGCQRARKAEWQRNKMRTDPEYKANQSQSHQEWLRANPSYWKDYRKRKPEKAERNRLLQAIRNRRRGRFDEAHARENPPLIAKMDASKAEDFRPIGQFWLVPVIAKMDALKIFLHPIAAP